MRSPSSKTYIAVVEDDESMCRSLARLLQAADYQPVTFLSGESFLQDKKRPQFDCLIFDIRLNGTSGIDLYRRLCDEGVYAPVIFLSAEEEAESAYGAEVDSSRMVFMHKQEVAEVLLSVIRDLISVSKGP